MARTLLLLLLALLSSPLKILLYRRLFGWRIGRGVRIGLSFLDARQVTIGENSYLGAHVLVVPGASVAPNTVVAMGALVTKTVEEQFVLLGGAPARIVKDLDRQALWFTRDRPGHRRGTRSIPVHNSRKDD